MSTRRTRQSGPPPSDISKPTKENADTDKGTSEAYVHNLTIASTVSPNEPSKQEPPKASLKRKELTNDLLRSASKKPRLAKPLPSTTVPAENNLKDSVRDGLILISIGLNPGITTGKTGHAYAHPSNRYWPTLHKSGITPIQHKPSETHSLMSLYGLGHTNIIPDLATVGGNSLTAADYLRGAEILDTKIRQLRPEAVLIVGKGIWEEWFRYKTGRKMKKSEEFKYGWQDKGLWIGRKQGEWEEGARTFVATTTSGLSSSHTVEERVAIWKPMGDWFTPRRERWVEDRMRKEKGKLNER